MRGVRSAKRVGANGCAVSDAGLGLRLMTTTPEIELV